MKKFKKISIEVEAAQWNGMTNEDAATFTEEHNLPRMNVGKKDNLFGLIVETLEGKAVAPKGTWIVKGIKNELWPVRNDIFKKSYKEVNQKLDEKKSCQY